ncbi:hypothetical protein HK097_006628 [Rhizophlyctis rosea]|uniref:HNH nuclease domain-containing protein n=1 Tax=Rhizophlyctis rosea TaxID=64517 RepID=A0AAD5SFK3_9FUNG|nr:hypothetical protein HK097_006628 [Rhizophlyctis rosea]
MSSHFIPDSTALADARKALDEYFPNDPAPVGGETPETAKKLLEAVLTHGIEPITMARYILKHKDTLMHVSNSIWLFFLLVKAAGGKTPAPTPLSSPASSRAGTHRINTGSQHYASRLAAERDAYRCGATGCYDFKIHGTPAFGVEHDGAHILPFSLCNLNDEKGGLFDEIMDVFAPFIFIDRKNVDTLDNMLTLCNPAHKTFGRFGWIIEEHNRQGADAPSRNYLAIHASLGRILWASGRGESYMIDNLDDPDQIKVTDEYSRSILLEAMEKMNREKWAIQV